MLDLLTRLEEQLLLYLCLRYGMEDGGGRHGGGWKPPFHGGVGGVGGKVSL